MNDVLRVGTRTSPLALWQTRAVCDGLAKAGIKTEIVKISSLGDRSLGGDLSTALGQFVDAVDQALISGEVDLAVHSMKDVPVEHMQGIELVSVLPRFPVEDLLLHQGEGQTLAEVLSQRGDGTVLSMSASEVFSGFSKRAKFGSVASRRQAFALSLRPDIQPISVRGKVETRLLRLAQGWVDYLPLAEAGLLRLFEDGLLDDWMLELKAIRLDSSEWPCAPSQGAIAVHAKQDSLSEQVRLALEEHLTCSNTMSDVAKERDILQQLGGGCTYPAGVWCDDGMIHLKVAEEGWRAKASRKQACQTIDWQGDFADYSSIADSLQIPASEATSQSNPDAIKILSTSTSERLHYQILGDSRFSLTQHSGIELSTTDLDWQDFAKDLPAARSEWPWLVLTSPFAVQCATGQASGYWSKLPWATLGEGTAAACFANGITPTACADANDAEGLAQWLIANLESRPEIYLPRSSKSRQNLIEMLQEAGFSVTDWIAYDNQQRDLTGQIQPADFDILFLTSPSNARAYLQSGLQLPSKIVCIGQSTYQEVVSSGLDSSQVSCLDNPSGDALYAQVLQSEGFE